MMKTVVKSHKCLLCSAGDWHCTAPPPCAYKGHTRRGTNHTSKERIQLNGCFHVIVFTGEKKFRLAASIIDSH